MAPRKYSVLELLGMVRKTHNAPWRVRHAVMKLLKHDWDSHSLTVSLTKPESRCAAAE
jgi:hypothetical protein